MKLSRAQVRELRECEYAGKRPQTWREYLLGVATEPTTFAPEAVEQYFVFTGTGKRPSAPHPDLIRMLSPVNSVEFLVTSWKEGIADRLFIKHELFDGWIPESLEDKFKYTHPFTSSFGEAFKADLIETRMFTREPPNEVST